MEKCLAEEKAILYLPLKTKIPTLTTTSRDKTFLFVAMYEKAIEL